jgi:hypothetical protein
MKKFVFIALTVALLGGFLFYRSFISGPKYSLLQAKAAVKSHNVDAFEKYVNVESLISNLIDQAIQPNGFVNQLIPNLGIAENSLTFIKPQLAKAVRLEVRHYIETGEINGGINGRNPLLSIAAIAGAIIGDGSEFKEIAYVKEEGDHAFVGLEFNQPKYDTTMIIEIKMQNQGDYWQATELTNIGDLFQHIGRLEKQKFLNR